MIKKEKFSLRKNGKLLVPIALGIIWALPTNEANASEKESIKSPITYVANESLEVGKQEVKTQGNEGSLEFSNNPEGIPTVTRTNPTETIVEVGTKPVVKELIDKHKIIYELDETKNLGDDVKIAGQDGIQKTITSYKLQTSWQPEEVFEHAIKENYTFTKVENDGSTTTREVEKIDLDKLKTREEHIEAMNALASKWSLGVIIGENSMENIKETGDPNSVEDIKRFHNSNYISDKYIENIRKDYSLATELIQKIKTEYGPLSTENFENDDANDLLASLEYLLKLHENKETDLDYKPKINIKYSPKISEDLRKEFEEKLDKLPTAIKRIIPVISFEDIISPGFTSANSSQIRLDDTPSRRTKVLNSEELLEVFLHELGHVVDFKGGVYQEKVDEDGNGKSDDWAYAFSFSPEWITLFKKYYEENDNIWDYISKNKNRTTTGKAVSEAFAESFSKFILKKVYGIDYLRYAKNEFTNPRTGEKRLSHINVHPGKEVNVYAEGNKIVRVRYENAYDIFSKVEPYFESLYTQLFEQPRAVKLVVDKVLTENQERKDGKIIYGAKPIEKINALQPLLVYKADQSKDFGYESIIPGKEGKELVKTVYNLVNNKLKAKEIVTQVEEAENTLIIKGTRPLEKQIIRQENDNFVVDTIKISYILDEKTGLISEVSEITKSENFADIINNLENMHSNNRSLPGISNSELDSSEMHKATLEAVGERRLPKTSASKGSESGVAAYILSLFLLLFLIVNRKTIK